MIKCECYFEHISHKFPHANNLPHQLARMRLKILYPVLWTLLILSSIETKAQDKSFGTPPITNYKRSVYDAGTQNWCINQDKSGNIYVGNNKGLLEFDGSYWKTFRLPNYTIVRSFNFDNKGRIYVGGQNEIGYLTSDLYGKKKYVSLKNDVPAANRDFEDVWKTFIAGDTVFFCSEKAVFRFVQNKCKTIVPPSGRFENYFKLGHKLFFQDKDFSLFVLKGDSLSRICSGDALGNDRVVALLPYSADSTLIVSMSHGFYFLTGKKIKSWINPSTQFALENRPYCAAQLKDGNYAIGTTQDGIFIIDKQGRKLNNINTDKGLQNNTVLSIFQDKQKNLWLGLDNGIDYAEINSPFRMIESEMGVEGTGYAANIYKGKLYLGTNQGLYVRDWKGDGQLDNTKFRLIQSGKGQIWTITKLGSRLVVGTHTGAYYVDGDKLEMFSRIKGAWKFMELKNHPGYALEGTYTGLYLYKAADAEESSWNLIGKLKGFDESSRIFEEDSTGNIWVSHAYRGLYKIVLSENPIRIKKVVTYGKNRGLPTNLFISVSKIRNQLTFATPQGIYNFNSKLDTFLVNQDLTKILGSDANVQRLLEDEYGNVWFSADDHFGVIRVKEQGVYNKLEVRYFNELQDALVDGFEFVYAFDPHNVFIGTENGFIHYDPSAKADARFPFKLRLVNVMINSPRDSILPVAPSNADDSLVTLNSKENNLKFTYIAPNFEKLNRIEYRYKLEGFDDEWSQWSSKTEKEYTNLPYHHYVFKVEARNAYGSISNKASYHFQILPPWYASVYARIFYMFIALVLFLGFVRMVTLRERKKTEAFKEEQTRKLEKTEAEFKKKVEKNESEITKLKNEKLMDEMAHKTSELASATMHLVQKSEILVKIKSDLSELAKNAPDNIRQKVKRIERVIEADVRHDKNWERFESHFDQVHENFFKRLRSDHPELTPKDQRLCAYLRMNLTTKEIAPLLNISVRGVEISRYRLRKKLNLDSDTNLVEFIMDI